ncbi:MAG TPA: lecithin retinol acyltransferase family protein [Xenococcaceae cyanobacterium]
MRSDQIYVYRNLWEFDGVYQHHGIDCGDGTVIHYRKPSEVVERTSLVTFSRGNSISVKHYTQGFCFVPEVVVNRAESRLGEAKYNLLFNNCEHFANWCKTGISDSKQVRNFIPIIDRFDHQKLTEAIQRSLNQTNSNNAHRLVQTALDDIKVVWEQLQPEYKQAIAEVESWQKVAQEAIKRDRDDLARAALLKKRNYQQKAQQLEHELQELADMTEKLLISDR